MKVTIDRVITNAYFASGEPGTEIRVRAHIDPPIKRPEEQGYGADEVTVVEFEVYSDDDHSFKPLMPGTTWVKPLGYHLTKKGTRNRTKNFGRLRRDLSPGAEARIIMHMQKDPNLPEALRMETARA